MVDSWVWEPIGKAIMDKAIGLLKEQWERVGWIEASGKYKKQIRSLHSTMRILYKREIVSFDDYYVDIRVLDRLSADRKYGKDQLHDLYGEYGFIPGQGERLSGYQIACAENRLFILGKPGSGKTTLLKYLTILAAENKINRIPIFVSFHEWARWQQEDIDLSAFIAGQFDICGFPNAGKFIDVLFEKGQAMILFDGLDEVSDSDGLRTRLLAVVKDLVSKYRRTENKFFITCRNAGIGEYLEGFRYVEIADFTPEQTYWFSKKWFGGNETSEKFIMELRQEHNRGFEELSRNPLLLSLLCLYYHENRYFPSRKIQLYRDAIDALLKFWDDERGIVRIYRDMTLEEKRELYSKIAAHFFIRGEIFFEDQDLIKKVLEYTKGFHTAKDKTQDGIDLLRVIEAQNGLIVQRAQHVFSFSHLTFQEYFTAFYLMEFCSGLEKLSLLKWIIDSRWREVFLLALGLAPSDAVDAYLDSLDATVKGVVSGNSELVRLLSLDSRIASECEKEDGQQTADRPARWIVQVLSFVYVYTLVQNLEKNLSHALELNRLAQTDWDLGIGTDLAFDIDGAQETIGLLLRFMQRTADLSHLENERECIAYARNLVGEISKNFSETHRTLRILPVPLSRNLLDELAIELKDLTDKLGAVQRRLSGRQTTLEDGRRFDAYFENLSAGARKITRVVERALKTRGRSPMITLGNAEFGLLLDYLTASTVFWDCMVNAGKSPSLNNVMRFRDH